MNRSLYIGAVCIFLVACMVRIAYFRSAGAPTDVLVPGAVSARYSDAVDYFSLGRSLAETGTYGYDGRVSAYRPPGYPFLLAAVYRITGRLDPVVIRFIQIGLSAAACVLLMLAAGNLAGTVGGFVTGVLSAIHPLFIHFSIQLLSETLCLFLLSGSWYLMFGPGRKSAPGKAGAGILWGAAALTRSVLLPLGALPALLLAYTGRCRRWRDGLLFITGMLLMITPWTVRNAVDFGSFIPISTNGGYNFYLGNARYLAWSGRTSDGTDLLPVGVYDDTSMETALAPAPETTAERNAYREGRRFILEHPGRFVLQVWYKTIDYWDIAVSTGHSLFVRVMMFVFGLMLYIAAAAALITGWRETRYRGPIRLLALFLAASWAIHLFFISGIRMRMPLADPVLLILAAAGIPVLVAFMAHHSRIRRGITVLMYHAVVANDEELSTLAPEDRPYAVRLDAFRQQLDMLVAAKVRMCDPVDNLSVDAGKGEPAPVLLTFDDGYADFARTVVPELERRNMTAAVFMTAGKIGRKGYMDERDLRICIDRGMRVGSHGMTHCFLSDLGDRELEEELAGSRSVLGQATATAVTDLSLPGGRGGDRCLAMARKAGYRRIFGSRFGRTVAADGPAGLRRIPVKLDTDMDAFGAIIAGDMGWYGQRIVIEWAKSLVRRIGGNRLYHRWYRLTAGEKA